MTDEPRCVDAGKDPAGAAECGGAVQYRMPLSSTGVAHPRCNAHWSKRLDREDQHRRNYPDSPVPPPWFDPAAAGETWDDES